MMKVQPVPFSARLLRRLQRDESAVTLVEFGIISPVLFLMIMGLFDMSHVVYTTSLVDGAMQRAARDLTIEGASVREAQIDARVLEQVRAVVPTNATITLEKLSYSDFNAVGTPEEFTDTNKDGRCNNGEPYADANRNGRWDADRGAAGIGGARDVMLYNVRVSYPRVFPMYGVVGMSQNATVQGSTVLRNQPYDAQNRSVQTRNCP